MPRATAHEAEETRREILDTALPIFAKRGFAATRVSDIAAAVGMTRGAIYGHFESKTDLFLEIIRLSQEPIYELLEELQAAAAVEPVAALRGFLLGWHRRLLEDDAHRAGFELVMTKTTFVDDLAALYRREKKLTRDVLSAVAGVVHNAPDAFPEELDPEDAALQVYVHLMGVTQSWLFNPRLFSLAKQAEPLTDSVLAGLGIAASAAHRQPRASPKPRR